MRILSILMIVVVLAFVASARGQDSASRPPGVSEKEWVAISDTLGLVVVPRSGPPMKTDPQVLIVAQPVNGYFMVKRADRWQRLVVLELPEGAG